MSSVKRYRVYVGPPGEERCIAATTTRSRAQAEANRIACDNPRVKIWDVVTKRWIVLSGQIVTPIGPDDAPE